MRYGMTAGLALMGAGLPVQAPVQAIPPRIVSPSFDCAKAKKGTIDQVISKDRELSILDRTMGLDYERAKLPTPPVEAANLLREQRACIAFAYESRIERLGEWIDRSAWVSE